MTPPSRRNKRFNPHEFLGNTLAFAKYGRLAVLLFAVGLLCGLAYYVFSTAAYYARSTVRVDMFAYAVDSESADAVKQPVTRAKRSLLNQLDSPEMLRRVSLRMGLVDENTSAATVRESVITGFKAGMEDNDHIVVEVEAIRPEIVRDFTETLVEEYQDYQSKAREEYRKKAVARYIKEMEGIKEKLASRLEEKSRFEEENELVNIFVAQKQLSQVPVEYIWVKHRLKQIDELAKTLESGTIDAQTKLSIIHSFNEEVPDEVGRIMRSEKEGASPIRVTEGETAIIKPERIAKPELWRNLEKQRLLLVEKINEARQEGFLSESDKMKDLNTQLRDVEGKLALELEQALKQVELERGKLVARQGVLEAQLPEYNEITRKYDQFRLDYEMIAKGELAWDKAHEEISERIAALEFGADKDRVELQFVGHTNLRDEVPVKPNKMKLLLMSLILGLGLASAIPVGLSMFDSTTSRLQQIESATGLVGLGVVPICKRENLENIVRSPMLGAKIPNQLLENFRIIRSNICLHPGRHNRSQVVMVTSARPSEGKTTQAANIAWAFHSIGEKTLLIDNDLRRGRIHEVTGLDNSVGMTNLLIGKATPRQVIQRTELELLDVITRGPVIAGSTEVLSQEFYDQMVEHWRGEYDRIVIDTPPVLGLSETGSLQRVADGVVLVVRAESTTEKDVCDAVELLEKSGAHMFGFVLNRVDLSKSVNYYYYQYYSADYYADFEDVMNKEAEAALEASAVPQVPAARQGGQAEGEIAPTIADDLIDDSKVVRRPNQRSAAKRGNHRVRETDSV